MADLAPIDTPADLIDCIVAVVGVAEASVDGAQVVIRFEDEEQLALDLVKDLHDLLVVE